MLRSISILLLVVTIGCGDKEDQRANELYELVDYYGHIRDYDRAIAILQQIRIDYENSESAKKAEDEIANYEELKSIFIQSQRSRLKTSFDVIGRALENYKERFQAYPLTFKDLDKLPEAIIPKWEDPWEHQILYKPTYSSPTMPRHSPDDYVLASFGKDGLPGGTAQNKDYFYQDSSIVERFSPE